MKFSLPKRRRYRILLYLISVPLILLAVDLLWVRIDRHITVGTDTTHITSPLKPDGFPDFVRFIEENASAGITHENNAAVLLQQAFGPSILRDFAVQPAYSRLGLQVPTPNDTTPFFVSYANDLKNQTPPQNPSLDISDAAARPWTPSQNPLLAACIEKNAAALDLFHQAVQRPRYFFPMLSSPGHDEAISMLVLQVNPLSDLGQIVAARAMLRAGAADFPAAHADLLDIHKLARLVAQQPTLIEMARALSLEKLASEGDQLIASSEKLTAPQARQFLADLQNLPPFPLIAPAIDDERLFGLDATIFAARIGLPEANRIIISDFSAENASLGLMLRLYLVPANFNGAMRLANSYYDRLIDAAKAPTFTQRIAIARSLESEAQTLHDTAIDPARTFLSYLMPGIIKILTNSDVARMQFDLSRTSLALAAYHAEHGAYPASLDALTPTYLPSLPQDLFVDAPLHYVPAPHGYRLYSVGINMQDDGGEHGASREAGHPKDDLVVSVHPR